MMDFTGRTAEVLFETGFHFKLEYLSETEMRYTSLMPDTKGTTEVVTITQREITDGIYAVSWVEKAGTTVQHIIDTIKGRVEAFMTWPDSEAYGGHARLYHQGSFTWLDNSDAPMSRQDLVVTFYERFFNQKDISAADDYVSEETYLQHNPGGKDGREAFKTGFRYLFEHDLSDAHYDIRHVVTQDDLVGIHSLVKVSATDVGTAAFDLFRVKDNKIVEHWDVLQPIPRDKSNPREMV